MILLQIQQYHIVNYFSLVFATFQNDSKCKTRNNDIIFKKLVVVVLRCIAEWATGPQIPHSNPMSFLANFLSLDQIRWSPTYCGWNDKIPQWLMWAVSINRKEIISVINAIELGKRAWQSPRIVAPTVASIYKEMLKIREFSQREEEE